MKNSNNTMDTQTLLREHGMKATPQRLAIAKLLLVKPLHVTAQQVFEWLKPGFPSMSQNTVYLTLASFEESGLLRRFHANGRTVFDSNTISHDHACCVACDAINDISSQDKAALPAALSSWTIKEESHTWMGLCPQCRAKD